MGRGGDARWQRVPHVPGGVIVQTGYALEKLTNGALPATRHRVVNSQQAQQPVPQGARLARLHPTAVGDRHSVAVFYDPSPQALIGPLPQFVNASFPSRYETCVAGKKGVRFGDPRYLSAHGTTDWHRSLDGGLIVEDTGIVSMQTSPTRLCRLHEKHVAWYPDVI